jgi:tetratricopeptide (TPR) repeat protein
MDPKQEACLSAPEILEYLDGAVPSGRKAEIDRHLDGCRLCEAAVEGAGGLEWRGGFLKSSDSLRARIRARTAMAVAAKAMARPTVRRFRSAPQYLTLAAALAVGAGATVFLTRPAPGEVVFQRHFEPYPSTRPVVRGAVADLGSSGLSLYEARDYRGALTALEDRLEREPNDPVLLFYAGLSRLALGETQEATVDLERVLGLGDSELRAPAEWYLALASLRNQDSAEAWYLALAQHHRRDLAASKTRLEAIAESGGFYAEKARQVLSDLGGLDRGN